MKKILSIMMLICIGLSAYAINYPTYKPDPRDRQIQQPRPVMQRQEAQAVGGYSTVATGGTTTTGEGSAIGGPRRVRTTDDLKEDENLPTNPNLGDFYTDKDGDKWQWLGDEWSLVPDNHPTDPQPVGSPMVMLLFAAAACAAIRFRRRNAQA